MAKVDAEQAVHLCRFAACPTGPPIEYMLPVQSKRSLIMVQPAAAAARFPFLCVARLHQDAS